MARRCPPLWLRATNSLVAHNGVSAHVDPPRTRFPPEKNFRNSGTTAHFSTSIPSRSQLGIPRTDSPRAFPSICTPPRSKTGLVHVATFFGSKWGKWALAKSPPVKCGPFSFLNRLYLGGGSPPEPGRPNRNV
jgi:hypothetical protein